MNYRLQQPGEKAETQLYLVNLLNEWTEPACASSEFACPTDPMDRTLVQKGGCSHAVPERGRDGVGVPVLDEEGTGWDLLLPYVLFAIRETTHASTRLSPSKLLFRPHPRDHLNVAQEAWKEQPSPYHSVVHHVQEKQQEMDKVNLLEAAQRHQQRIYNRPTQAREFQPCLSGVPAPTCNFLDRWQGPSTTVEWVGAMNYRLQQPGEKAETQLYLVNLLNEWTEPACASSEFACPTDPMDRTLVQKGAVLTPSQNEDVTELVYRSADVFPSNPAIYYKLSCYYLQFKQIEEHVLDEEGTGWDLLLPYVLFAIRETTHASTRLSPSKLLFRPHPRDHLNVAQEAWKEQPSPYHSVVHHVQEKQQEMDKVNLLEAAQRHQQRIYNRPTQAREFQPCLSGVPAPTCNFLDRWQGPSTTVEWVGAMNYRLQQPGEKAETQLYLVNLLNEWTEPACASSEFACPTDPMDRTLVQKGAVLTPSQNEDVTELVYRSADVFPSNPAIYYKLSCYYLQFKQIEEHVLDEEGTGWDLLLPYVLFAIRETTHASTRLSPSKLLFRPHPRDHLNVAQEAWKEQPSPYHSVVHHVQEKQQEMDKVNLLEAAQRHQQRIYNRPTQAREFQPCLSGVPAPTCNFLDRWQGPSTTVEWVGAMNYRLQQPGEKAETQLYLVNLLNEWTEPACASSEFACPTDPMDRTLVQKGAVLTPSQNEDVTELVYRSADVFPSNPAIYYKLSCYYLQFKQIEEHVQNEQNSRYLPIHAY
ncbi:hypothetical protein QTP70_014587 [Hemibagrus guttatus]|uniref:Uncharacterized protein n=1 Tax=Hemibagrus guttatus TaxID=175788 RepID=A0AAE0Q0S6_9TELE|nr:hypothetical protein QTP70_014587 [Hemibagrus guttatus]